MMQSRFFHLLLIMMVSVGIFAQENGRMLVLPPLDNMSLLQKHPEQKNLKNPSALRFAEVRSVLITQSNLDWKISGMYFRTAYVIKSPGATSLNLLLRKLKLPPSTRIRINSLKDGAWVELNETIIKHSEYWTPIFLGDEINIEISILQSEYSDLELEIHQVNHGFRELLSKFSQGCNLDVNCGPQDGFEIINGYREAISSVVALQINGIFSCSGTLINNTTLDGTPYVITAVHCGINEENANSVNTYFNYQNSFCRDTSSAASAGEGDGILDFVIQGASTVAQINSISKPVDMELIKLDSRPLLDWEVHYSGWNRNDLLPDMSAVIHHPNVEEKRISFDFDPLEFRVLDNVRTNVQVNNYEIGSTEGGSSGSGLFDEQQRWIGQLSGGTASCFNRSGFDVFGWIGEAWEGNGTPQTRLKDWLDPLNSLEEKLMSFDGSLTLSSNSLDTSLCSGSNDSYIFEVFLHHAVDSQIVHYSVTSSVDDVTLHLSADSIQGDSKVQVTTTGLINLIDTLTITVTASTIDNQGNSIVRYLIRTIELLGRIGPDLIAPVNGMTDLGTSGYLQVNNKDQLLTEFEISQDSQFQNVVFNFSSEDIYTRYQNLIPGELYFWRSRSLNTCGLSMWSKANKFYTREEVCKAYSANNLPLLISTGTDNVLNSPIDVGFNAEITDVNLLNININHSFIGDLTLNLNNGANESNILNRPCGSFEDIDVNIDQQSPLLSINCPLDSGEFFSPFNSFDNIINSISDSIWTLNLIDNINGDGGQWNNWDLEICFDVLHSDVVFTAQNSFDLCSSDTINIKILELENSSTELFVLDDNLTSIPYISLKDTNSVFLNILIARNTLQNPNYIIIGKGTTIDDLTAHDTILVHTIPQNILVDLSNQFPTDTITDQNPLDLSPIGIPILVEIATDSSFNNLIYSQELNTMPLNIDFSNLTTQSGTLYYRLRANDACIIELTDSLFYQAPIATREIAISLITITPNPATSHISIQSNTPLQTVTIYTLEGKELFSVSDINNTEYILGLTELNTGIYIAKVNSTASEQVQKLVIQSN